MRLAPRILVAAAMLLLAAACQSDPSNPDGCPRAGLDSARRCKRLCVINTNQIGRPLPCTCSAECLCWQMAGHPRRPDPDEPIFNDPRSEADASAVLKSGR